MPKDRRVGIDTRKIKVARENEGTAYSVRPA